MTPECSEDLQRLGIYQKVFIKRLLQGDSFGFTKSAWVNRPHESPLDQHRFFTLATLNINFYHFSDLLILHFVFRVFHIKIAGYAQFYLVSGIN